MWKNMDLSKFETGPIMMGRRQGQIISETARLVEWSGLAKANTYWKVVWGGEKEIVSTECGVAMAHECKRWMKAVPFSMNQRATVAQILNNFNARDGSNVLQQTLNPAEYGTAKLQTTLSARFTINAPTMIMSTGPWTNRGRSLDPMNPVLSCTMWMTGYMHFIHLGKC